MDADRLGAPRLGREQAQRTLRIPKLDRDTAEPNKNGGLDFK